MAIVVGIDEEKASTWVEDASISAAYIQLAAHSLGLGSCWAHVRERSCSEDSSHRRVM
ncbi:MAG: nitroreductase family protein [Caldicoprobacterales bacterium]